MKSISPFVRRTIAAIIAMESANIAADPDYFGDADLEGLLPILHAEPTDNDTDILGVGGRIDHYAIMDQFGYVTGYLSISEETASFAYSIITG